MASQQTREYFDQQQHTSTSGHTQKVTAVVSDAKTGAVIATFDDVGTPVDTRPGSGGIARDQREFEPKVKKRGRGRVSSLTDTFLIVPLGLR